MVSGGYLSLYYTVNNKISLHMLFKKKTVSLRTLSGSDKNVGFNIKKILTKKIVLIPKFRLVVIETLFIFSGLVEGHLKGSKEQKGSVHVTSVS